MSVGTVALLFVVPVFFIVFQGLHEKYQGKEVAVETVEAAVEETKIEEKSQE
jgi:hypothetical protein